MDPDPTEHRPAREAAARVGLTFSLCPCPAATDLGPQWLALQARSDASFFTSFTWIGTWLQQLGGEREPQLLRVHDGAQTVGLGVFVGCQAQRLRGAVRHRAAVLHATGRQEEDDLTVEHNGLLLQRGLGPRVHATALAHLLHSGGYDEVRVPMAGGESTAGPWPSSRSGLLNGPGPGPGWAPDPSWPAGPGRLPGVSRYALQTGYVASLERARACGGEYLAMLSGPTRSKVRRSLKRYAELGAVRLRVAADVDEALHGLGRLKALHQAAWQARGLPGAFANPRFEAFHRALLRAGHPQGEVQLLSVHAGPREVGYLLQFRRGERVLAYQSGFDYGLLPGNHHPGLVVHALAMQHALEQGASCYDFLAGDARYKRDLGGQAYPMGNWSLHRHGPTVWAQEALRVGRTALARAALSLRKRPPPPPPDARLP